MSAYDRGHMRGKSRFGRDRSALAVRSKEVRSASAAISQVIDHRGLAEPLRAQRIAVEWRQLVGERIAARAWPDGLSRRTLWIRVSNSAWMQELGLLRPQLEQRLRQGLGEPSLFDEVRFHLGQRKAEADDVLAATSMRSTARPKRTPSPVAASGPVLAAIESETSVVADDELRELIRAVRVRHDR